MNQENLSGDQIEHLRTASQWFYDQQTVAGEPFAELGAALKAAEEIGIVTAGVVLGAAKHLNRKARNDLYGPNAPTKTLTHRGK